MKSNYYKKYLKYKLKYNNFKKLKGGTIKTDQVKIFCSTNIDKQLVTFNNNELQLQKYFEIFKSCLPVWDFLGYPKKSLSEIFKDTVTELDSDKYRKKDETEQLKNKTFSVINSQNVYDEKVFSLNFIDFFDYLDINKLNKYNKNFFKEYTFQLELDNFLDTVIKNDDFKLLYKKIKLFQDFFIKCRKFSGIKKLIKRNMHIGDEIFIFDSLLYLFAPQYLFSKIKEYYKKITNDDLIELDLFAKLVQFKNVDDIYTYIEQLQMTINEINSKLEISAKNLENVKNANNNKKKYIERFKDILEKLPTTQKSLTTLITQIKELIKDKTKIYDEYKHIKSTKQNFNNPLLKNTHENDDSPHAEFADSPDESPRDSPDESPGDSPGSYINGDLRKLPWNDTDDIINNFSTFLNKYEENEKKNTDELIFELVSIDLKKMYSDIENIDTLIIILKKTNNEIINKLLKLIELLTIFITNINNIFLSKISGYSLTDTLSNILVIITTNFEHIKENIDMLQYFVEISKNDIIDNFNMYNTVIIYDNSYLIFVEIFILKDIKLFQGPYYIISGFFILPSLYLKNLLNNLHKTIELQSMKNYLEENFLLFEYHRVHNFKIFNLSLFE